MSAPGAGWYDDGSGGMRWWDGSQWGATAPPPTGGDRPLGGVTTSAAAQPSRGRIGLWIAAGIAATAVVAVALGLGAAVLVSQTLSTPGALVTPTPTASDAVPATADEAEGAEPEDDLLHPEDWDIVGPAVEPANDDERAALAAVDLYEQSWESGKCDDYMAAASLEWREALYIADCETFAQVFASLEGSDDELKPALIKATGPRSYTIGVVLTMQVDPEALPGDDPGISEWRTVASYHVRKSGDNWRVEEVHDLDDGREEGEMAPGEEAESERTLAQWEEAIVGGNCGPTVPHCRHGFRNARSGAR
jgi:hypothetical protein